MKKSILFSTIVLASFATANQIAADEVGQVDSMDFTNVENQEMTRWESREVTVEFSVPNEVEVQPGDTTTLALPPAVSFTREEDFSVELRNDADVHFADANASIENRDVTIVYNDNVVGLENIQGGFNFMIKINNSAVPTIGKVSQPYTYETAYEGNKDFTFEYVGVKIEPAVDWTKRAWQDQANPDRIKNQIPIGEDGTKFGYVEIIDDIAEESEDNITYDYSTLKVKKGIWVEDAERGRYLAYANDATDEFELVEATAGHFKLRSKDKLNRDISGYQVEYDTVFISPVEADERVINRAYLYNNGEDRGEHVASTVIFDMNGWINANRKPLPEIPEIPGRGGDIPETPEEPNEEPEVPTVDIPEEPKEEPEVPTVDIPEEPKEEPEVPTVDIPEEPKEEPEVPTTTKPVVEQSVLPQTGTESFDPFIIILGVVVGLIVSGVFGGDKNKHKNKKDK